MTFALPAAGRYVLKQARVLGRMLPKPVPPVDFDGFAIVDILVDEGAIAKIVPAGVEDFGEAPEVAMSGRIVLPLFVDVHTHLDKGHIWRRKRNPVGDFPSARRGDDRGPFRQLERRRRRGAHGVQPALSLRARDDGHSHPYRQRRPADENQLAGPGRSARALACGRIDIQASPLFTIDHLANPTHMADIEAMLDAYGSGILGAATPHGAGSA